MRSLHPADAAHKGFGTNPKAYCWLIRSLKAQGMNELATNELAAAKEHLTTEEYEEILAFGANW